MHVDSLGHLQALDREEAKVGPLAAQAELARSVRIIGKGNEELGSLFETEVPVAGKMRLAVPVDDAEEADAGSAVGILAAPQAHLGTFE